MGTTLSLPLDSTSINVVLICHVAKLFQQVALRVTILNWQDMKEERACMRVISIHTSFISLSAS